VKATTSDAVSQLCPACGLCCNGVLFGDVELQRDDDAKILTQLHLDLFRKGRKTAFSQPCSCFDGKLCSIYTDRPKQCRAFECGLIKRVSAGKLTTGAALKVIAETRRRSEALLNLVREFGNTDEAKPLNRRYADVVGQPIDMAADEADLERRGELMMGVASLMKLLQQDFLA
jgi:Fe-S-cluster containining protein